MQRCGVDEGRRGFLKRLAIGGVAAFSGCAVGSRAATAALQSQPTEDPVEVLDEPIVLRAGETLQDRSFALSSQFRGSGANAILVVAGDGVLIRNVRVIGSAQWDPRWSDPRPGVAEAPGVFGRSAGIRAQNVRDLRVEQVSIEGLPRAAIAGFGLDGARFRDVRIRHCYHGINFALNAPSTNVTIERVQVGDLWGPPPEFATADGKANNPSRARPGGWIGGDGMALNSLRDSTLRDCVAVGEMFAAFKLTNPHRVTVQRFRGCGFQLQGVAKGRAGRRMAPARDVIVEDCVFDKALGYGISVRDANCVQVTYHFGSAWIRRCLLNAAGRNGHGIQITSDSHARIEQCTVRGFNGVRGSTPAHACDVAPDSSVNADFERVNQFVDQRRILLRRGSASG